MTFEKEIYGLLIIRIFLWLPQPIVMFVYNMISESDIKKLGSLQIISTGSQLLEAILHLTLYFAFVAEDLMGQLILGIVVLYTFLLNILLAAAQVWI